MSDDTKLTEAELRELLAAATPGPWRAVEGDLEGRPASEYVRTLFANREADDTSSGRLFLTLAANPIDPEAGAEVVPALTGDGPQAEVNAALIVAAVNALSGHLTELAELRAELEQVKGERDEALGASNANHLAKVRWYERATAAEADLARVRELRDEWESDGKRIGYDGREQHENDLLARTVVPALDRALDGERGEQP